jgi:hypothetical protein
MRDDALSGRRSASRAAGSQWLPPAIGMHVGLAIVCASALYTAWQPTIITLPQWAVMILVGATLVGVGLSRRRGLECKSWVQLALGLAGLLVLRLCYEPQIGGIPRLGEELPQAFRDAYPSIALVGTAIAVVCWLAYRSAGGERGLTPPSFRHSAAGAAGLVMLLALVAFFILHRTHDLPASELLRPVLAAAQGGGLVVVLVGIGGGPGVRKSPHLYLGLTLLLAFVRNLAFPAQ